MGQNNHHKTKIVAGYMVCSKTKVRECRSTKRKPVPVSRDQKRLV